MATEFEIMLRAFNSLINDAPPVETVKNELLDLKEAAKNSKELNYRQVDAITARCDNYINGEYGVNRKKQEYQLNNK